MIKLVALDLDGTIVNGELQISDRVLKLLKHLIDDTEVRVVVATGRMHPSAMPFVKQIGTPWPVVTYQGAMIRDQDEHFTLMHHTPIRLDVARKVMQLLIEEKFSTNLYVNDVMYTNHANKFATRYARLAGITPVMDDDLLGRLTHAPSKIMAIDDDRIDYIQDALRANFPTDLSYCRSRPNFCEIIDVNASKWNALKFLADRWGILPEEIMAVGDQENDLSMIRHAGIGVAMGDAPDNVKAVANYVTEAIDGDGAALAIEKFVLGDMPLDPHPEKTREEKAREEISG